MEHVSFSLLNFRKRTVYLVVVFVLFLFAFSVVGYLNPVVAVDQYSDTGNYADFWSGLNQFPLRDVITRYEPGFVMLCKVCSVVMSFSAFLWFVQFLVFYSTFVLFSRYSNSILLAAGLALACLIFYLPLTSLAVLVIRQGLAAVIFFCFLTRYHGGVARWRAALPWLLAMVLFHYSSAFVLISIGLMAFVPGRRAFYVWCIFMLLYCANVSGQIGLFVYEMMGMSIASLDALNNSSGVDYAVGFKLSFIVLNAFFVFFPVVLIKLGVVKAKIRDIYSDDLFRLYFVLNAFASVFSLFPFYDRFFMWSWIVGPVLLLSIWRCKKIVWISSWHAPDFARRRQ